MTRLTDLTLAGALDMIFGGILYSSSSGEYWQGDEFFILASSSSERKIEHWNRIGFLSASYGSCSGCDEWTSTTEGFWQEESDAPAIVETVNLLAEKVKDIKWFDSEEELLKYLTGPDIELQWYAHDEGFKTLIRNIEAGKKDNQDEKGEKK